MKKIKINYVILLSVSLLLIAITTFGWKNNQKVNLSSNIKVENTLKDYTKAFVDFGPRNIKNYENLTRSTNYIQNEFSKLGYNIEINNFDMDGKSLVNIQANKKNSIDNNKPKIIIGAHYNTGKYSSANGDATPIAALLTLAELVKENPNYNIEFVAFVNKRIPYMNSKEFGSNEYVKLINKNKQNIKGVIILDSLGFFNNNILSQRYPIIGPSMGTRGNFIAFNGNNQSKDFSNKLSKLFNEGSNVPLVSQCEITLGRKASGINSFWKENYPAILISDTGMLRNLNIYNNDDKIEKINFEYMSNVINGLGKALNNFK